jgi:ribonuclease P protein component
MIPAKNRFIGNRTIERVYKSARPVRSGSFNIRVKKSGLNDYRVAVVVSKKVSKSAVIRNRIRRRIFEHVRKNIGSDPQIAGCEIIITVFEESVAAIEPKDLDKQLKKLFEKAGIK